MNTKHLIPTNGTKRLLMLIAAFSLAPFAAQAATETHTITSDTTQPTKLPAAASTDYFWIVSDGATLTISAPNNTGGSGSVYSYTSTGTLTMGPASTGGTGKIMFSGNGTPTSASVGYVGSTKQGGAININTGGLNLTNVTFQNYWAVGQGGAIYFGTAAANQIALATLNNVNFLNNGASVNGGAILLGANAKLVINGGTFANNRADGFAASTPIAATTTYAGNGGAITMWASNTQTIVAKNVVFTNNNAIGTSGIGGALYLRTGKSYFLDSMFTSNTAGGQGGAIGISDGQVLTIEVTKDAAYVGNVACATGSTFGVASGSAGGFLSIAGSSTTNFNITSGKTLTIGSASNVNADTIAGSTSSADIVINAGGGDANSTINAAAATGTLVLNAASTSYTGTIAIANGTVLLGNQNAVLSGKIAVAAPATFGGSGSVANGSAVSAANGATIIIGSGTATGLLTFGTTGAAGSTNGLTYVGTGKLIGSGTIAGSVALNDVLTANITGTAPLVVAASISGINGSITKIGSGKLTFAADNTAFTGPININAGTVDFAGNAIYGGNVIVNPGGVIGIDAVNGTPTILGNLNLAGGTVALDNLNNAVPLNVGSLTIGSDNTVDINQLVNGTYTLINSTASITDPLAFNTTYKGSALTGRTLATYNALGGNTLQLTLAVTSAIRTWNSAGAQNSNWNTTGTNWVEGDRVTQDGDIVQFTGAGYTTPINVTAAGVIVSEMRVNNTSGTYAFTGGSIVGSASSWQGAAPSPAPTGKLIKSGSGTLVFSNSTNNFQGGIDISGGGVIAFNDALQLGTRDSGNIDQGITFSGNGALQATGTAITIANLVKIAASSTATIDTQANTVTYSGSLTGPATAAIDKIGIGTLRLTTDNSAYAGSTIVDAGMLHLASTGKLGGNIILNTGGTLAGTGVAAGNVTANAGSYIRVGGTSNTNTPEVLTINGSLTLNGATVGLKTKSASGITNVDSIAAGSLVTNGTNIFDFYVAPSSGTYTLVSTTGGVTLTSTNFITYSSGSIFTDERVDQHYFVQGNSLVLTLQFASRVMTWSGSGDNIWRNNYGNWSGNAPTFLDDDSVVFNSTADSAHVANRTVAVDAGGVYVSDMTVSGNGNYTFNGGAIYGRIDKTTLAGATGRLIMNGSGAVTLNNDEADYFIGGIVVNSGTLVGTTVALGTNAVLVQSAGNMVLSQTMVGDYAGYVSGSGAVTKSGTATIGLASTGTIASKTFNVNQGTFRVSNGVVNVGTLNVNASGTMTLNGSANLTATTFNLNAGGRVNVNASITIKAGTFNQAGDLYIGQAARSSNPYTTFTINGNYVGQDGTLHLDTTFAKANSLADMLAVMGNASGSTLVDIIHPKTETGIPTTGKGIEIFSISGSNALDLKLAHQVNAGLYDYQIYKDTDGFYLRSNMSDAIMTANTIPAIAMLAGRASLDSLQSRLGEVRLDPARTSGLWFRDAYREDQLQKGWLRGVDVDTNVIQVGVDHAILNPNGTPDNWILGAFYNHTEAKADYNDKSQDKNNSDGGGVYAIFKRGKFYVEALGKADFLHANVATEYSARNTDGTIIGGSLESGYQLPISQKLGTLEPEVQMAYQYVRIQHSSDNQIPRYYYTGMPAFTVRGGIRWFDSVQLGKLALTPWVRVSYAYDCKNTYRTTITDTLNNTYYFDNSMRGGRLITDLGLSLQIATRISIYASGVYETGQRNETWAGSGGIRYAW